MRLDSRIDFHDATLNGVRKTKEGTICLSLDDVWVEDGPKNVTLLLSGVKKIVQDDVPVADFTMELPDASILALDEVDNQTIEMTLVWKDYSLHRQITRSYQFECKSATIELADRRSK